MTRHIVMKRSTVLCLVMMISFQVLGAVAGGAVPKQAVPAIYVFGDEVLDVGNNNYLPPAEAGDPVRADHPYYGIDFPGSKPTGRFSNGYNMADWVAKDMGFEMSPPAYLSLSTPIEMEAGFTGVNYASAGAGIWNSTNDEVTIPLLKQVDYFGATIGQMEAKLDHHEVSKLLSKSFFLISIGTSDLYYIYNLLNSPWRDNNTDVQHLVSSYGAGIKALYNLGARKFGIVNMPPLGCGQYRMQRPYGPAGCDDVMNNLAREFNDGLKPLLAGLGSNLKDLRYSIADFYAFSNATFTNPSAYGFVNTDSACCNGPCVPELIQYYGPPCDNRTQYWFWNQMFISEQAAKLSAATFFDGPAQFTMPVSFKQLINKK